MTGKPGLACFENVGILAENQEKSGKFPVT